MTRREVAMAQHTAQFLGAEETSGGELSRGN